MTQEVPKTPAPSSEHKRLQPTSASPVAPKAKKQGTKGKKIANSLVALSSAAIVSVYGLGYARTQSAEAHLTTNIAAANTVIPIATAAPTTTSGAQPTQAPAIKFPFPVPSGTTAPAATVGSSGRSVPTSISAVPTATAIAPTQIASAPTKPAPTGVGATSASAARYKDGTYTGTGSSRHGSIGATVIVQGGEIVSAEITQCGTRYPCSKVAALPGQVVAQQGGTVDLVSGATDSSEAYQGAIRNALAKATAA